MSAATNLQVVLKSRPVGEPTPDNFAIVTAPVPKPGVEFGHVIVGGTVSQVVESRDGLPNAPSAFIGLLRERNVGKMRVRVSPDPTR
jgi:NADPH-dependent curcumin reductase CurA